MNDKEIKIAIQTSLNAFASGNLFEKSIAFFKTLGYETKRQDPFKQNTFKFFKETFLDKNSRFNEGKALVKNWQSIDMLFQLTADEISKQLILFDTSKVDDTIIESYLFFALELTNKEYTRTTLAQITREINKIFSMPVMIVFKYGDNLTLSVINRRLNKNDELKDVLAKVTLIKDISTLTPHRAHIEILFDLSFERLNQTHKVKNFVELHNAWQKTLDTKELNKRFYRELSTWYFWAMKEVEFPTKLYEELDKTSILKKEEQIKEHNAKSLIRLLTRILFIWFIKEKNLIPEVLFDESYIRNNLINDFEPRKVTDFDHKTKGSKYYRAILQNLFFATLNQTAGKRKFRKENQNMNVTNLMRYENYFKDPKEFVKLVEEVVPFMNGGLFECLDSPDPSLKGEKGGDLIIYEDGFSDRKDNRLCVPDYIFFGKGEHADLSEELDDKKQKDVTVNGLIHILKSYKFTITENTPIEEDIALDPELLGHVFENLLASYNPETKTTARKATGSFYTPREIVNYMVDESLKVYLKQKLESETNMLPEDADIGLEFLFGYYEREHLFNEMQTNILINAIDNCKVLDPACGSGAFPMGILHKLVHILHKLDPQNNHWKERQIKKASSIEDPQVRENSIDDIETAFSNNELDYGRKLYLIENCIYGVDIQPIAIQISKLRFFISLIVDQKSKTGLTVSESNAKNFGIRPLPNLETKFVAANTLICIEKPKDQGNLFDDLEVKELEEKIKEVRHRLFSSKTPESKRKYRAEDLKLRASMSKILENSGLSNESARQFSSWDPYNQNASSSFFDPEWMFGVIDGFDIVIGNPPYGLINKKQNKEKSIVMPEAELNYYKTCDYYKPAIGGMINIFRLFVLRSIRLLSNNGIFSEIFPLAFIGDLSISKLRKYIFDNHQILFVEAFPERDNEHKRVFEGVKMSVCILNLQKVKSHKKFYIRINDNRYVDSNLVKNYLDEELIKVLDEKHMSFPLTSPEETALLIKVFAKSKRFSEIGKCNTGEIDMTFCKDAFTSDENNTVLLKGAIIDRYILRRKMSQGEVVYINEKKLSKIKPINRELFVNERIVLQGITGVNEKTRLKMMIVQNAFCANSLNYLTINYNIENKVLLGLFNSKLLNFIFSKFSTNSNVNGYEIDNLPICLNNNHFQSIIELVTYVLQLNLSDKSSIFFESIIDAIVYESYFPEEIKAANAEIHKFLLNLPKLQFEPAIEKKLDAIDQTTRELSDINHPVSIALSKQKTIPEIRIIEGLDK